MDIPIYKTIYNVIVNVYVAFYYLIKLYGATKIQLSINSVFFAMRFNMFY